MKTKQCFKCKKTKPISHFYKHSEMADGYLNKCKECTKKEAIENRAKKLEYYREYDRSRANLPHRVKLRDEVYERRKTDPKLKKKCAANRKAWQERNKEKRAAHILTGSAIKSGKLKKQPCEVCRKKKVEAHHDDYSKPLEVRWLCKKHHTEHHKKEREEQRKNGQ